jgi:hypothetical protein
VVVAHRENLGSKVTLGFKETLVQRVFGATPVWRVILAPKVTPALKGIPV